MFLTFIPAIPVAKHSAIRPNVHTSLTRSQSPWRLAESRRVRVAATTMQMSSDSREVTAVAGPIVPILMGSASDMSYCQKIADALTDLGIASTLRVASAHKVPARLLEVIQRFETDGRPKVYIAVAGRSNALSGMLDCAVSAPVISCPPPSDAFGGADIFSSIRMPSGVAPALVLEPATAALFAAKILAVYDDSLRARVEALQKANRDRLFIDDAEAVSKAYLPLISATRGAVQTIISTSPSLVFGSSNASSISQPISGKVRDRYDFSFRHSDGSVEDLAALVTTDRQSAFDRVLAAIPYKGAVLNLTAAWWFNATRHIIPNHIVAVPHAYVTVARRCKPFPIEFIVRGYITGSTATSLWKNYSNGVRTYCGIEFPDGLQKNQKLDQNVLTPTTKAVEGDELIAPKDVVSRGLMTQEDWDVCATAAMDLFEYGQRVAAERGLILVDTKYEFGRASDGTICLIDEIHTPDSSRYWLSTSYNQRMRRGEEPENIDKEFLRLWFSENCDPYDTSNPLPAAPDHLVDELSRRYIMLYELITGQPFDFSSTNPAALSEAMSPFVENMVAFAGKPSS